MRPPKKIKAKAPISTKIYFEDKKTKVP